MDGDQRSEPERADNRNSAEFLRPEFEKARQLLAREIDLEIARKSIAYQDSLQRLACSSLVRDIERASVVLYEFATSDRMANLVAKASLLLEETERRAAKYAALIETISASATRFADQFYFVLNANQRAIQGALAAQNQQFEAYQSATSALAELARRNYSIPEEALRHWTSEAFHARRLMVEDCVRNTSALEAFHSAIKSPASAQIQNLGVATTFVADHARIVRRLPPAIASDGTEDYPADASYQDEEIGSKLELALKVIDIRLLDLRRSAWGNLGSGVAGARLGMAGMRELFDEVLRRFAPESAIENTAEWMSRKVDQVARPTRRMRIAYILGEERADEADAIFQFEKSNKRTQKYVHTFADDVSLVRVQMANLEALIYLLVQCAGNKRE